MIDTSMFHSSTQKKFWIFKNEEELKSLRKSANVKYREEFCSKESNKKIDDDAFFLSVEEHKNLVQHYEKKLKDFCWKFNPPMPLTTVGTACHYMKRLYARKSVMEYHPKLMSLVCLWLAFKTEEFNISMDQFQQNIHWLAMHDSNEIGDVVLTLELTLIQELNFHLVIHNAFRPLEGFFIDLKTRFPSLSNPELLRNYAKDFIVRSLDTDVGLLYSPSQIALSALLSAASKRSLNIDQYVTDVLLRGQSPSLLKDTILRVKKIRTIVKNTPSSALDAPVVETIEAKLQNCYNKEKDPTSEDYQRILQELEHDRDVRQAKKRKVERERREKAEIDLLSF